VRSPRDDIEMLAQAGVWGQDDRLMHAVMLLCMYAKGRHKPTFNLHKLASAVEKGDERKSQKYYDRLVREVSTTLTMYPDIVGTLDTMSQLSDEDKEQIDRLMREAE